MKTNYCVWIIFWSLWIGLFLIGEFTDNVNAVPTKKQLPLEKADPDWTPKPLPPPTYDDFSKIVNIKGCQYAICWGQDISYTHIGTCTNCWKRMEDLIDRKLKEHK